ncbi:hypothetical protein Bbelb_326230 [Branchiostoma belcheri]|nr:hypothetical protein Bbelb_326230 [Branchiostoma belcheri]
MANPGEQDHLSPIQMNEYAGRMASNLTWAVNSWSMEMLRLQTENARLSAELRDLKDRTASVASERAVRDQDTEDITKKNRPRQIASSYKEFTDGDRMDALDALNKEFPLADKTYANARLVCEIFEAAFRVATVAISSVRDHLPRTLVNPTSLRTPNLKQEEKQHAGKEPVGVYFKYSTIPESETHRRDATLKGLANSISAYLIRTSSDVDVTDMKEDVLSDLEGRYPTDKQSQALLHKKLRLVQNFISDCCKLAWQLVVQTPSMHIQYNEKKFDPTKHELANRQPSTGTSKSTAGTGKKIRHYLWPTLLNNMSGIVVCKGVVVVTGDEPSGTEIN